MTARNAIDLNCDLGEDPSPEGLSRDAAIMRIVSSVNIACAVHAGDEATMRATVRAALLAGVALGAHPGLPDRAGMGRNVRTIEAEEAYRVVFEQTTALRAIASVFGATLAHVKPHGALYNAAAQSCELATAVARAVHDVDPALMLFGLAGSQSLRAGQAMGLTVIAEGFVDRAYRNDGGLVPRDQPGAVLESVEAVLAQAVTLATEGNVRTPDGTLITMQVETLCLHGDTPNALTLAERVRDELKACGIAIRSS